MITNLFWLKSIYYQAGQAACKDDLHGAGKDTAGA